MSTDERTDRSEPYRAPTSSPRFSGDGIEERIELARRVLPGLRDELPSKNREQRRRQSRAMLLRETANRLDRNGRRHRRRERALHAYGLRDVVRARRSPD